MKKAILFLSFLMGTSGAIASEPTRLISPSGDFIEYSCSTKEKDCVVDYHRVQAVCHKGFAYDSVWNTGRENKSVLMRCYRRPKSDGSIYFFRVSEVDLIEFIRDYDVFSVAMADNTGDIRASVFQVGPLRRAQ